MKLNWAELCLNRRIVLVWYRGLVIVGRWQCKANLAGTIDRYLNRAKGKIKKYCSKPALFGRHTKYRAIERRGVRRYVSKMGSMPAVRGRVRVVPYIVA